jgi:glycosyltransferase involved in cell wall biosynthesis
VDVESEARAEKSSLKLLVISTFPPKPCGIGTFTRDLLDGIVEGDGQTDYRVLAIEDPEEHFPYGWPVRQRIQKEELASLERAAAYCNACGADAVSIQHEFGIWGGFDGEFILHFLDRLQIPAVITLHSVPLTRSSFNRANRLRLIRAMTERAAHLVTFVPDARDFLVNACEAPAGKTSVIWHGAPRFPTGREAAAKHELGLDGRLVVSSFGLLTRFKGLDYAIRALPALVRRFPDLRYLLLGQPHPAEPASFLPGLRALVETLDLGQHVRFVDRYLTEREIGEYLAATDVYLTPYLDETQISSGTLTAALSAGKCCVATDYVYARNALAEGRGLLVPFADSAAITEALEPLLADPVQRAAYAARARAFGEQLAWPVVAAEFVDVVRGVVARSGRPGTLAATAPGAPRPCA